MPHELDEWVEIRRLSWTQLEEALRVRVKRAADTIQGFGGSFVNAVVEARTEIEKTAAESSDSVAKEKESSPEVDDYDLGLMLEYGIVAWSYEQEVTPELTRELDQTTAEFLREKIFEFNVGTKEEAKN